MKKFIYLIALTLFSSSVLAEGFYVGGGYLKSHTDIYKKETLDWHKRDDKNDGFTLFAGYDLNKRFAIEAGYNDLGITDIQGTLTGAGDIRAIFEISVMTLAGVIKTDPIAENLVIFAKAGFARNHKHETLSGISSSKLSSERTNPFFGIGADYELVNGLAVRALYEAYGKDDGLDDVNDTRVVPARSDPTAFSISLIKRF
ncbi:outer membrane beta-barrel protein [Candidatus Pelagibacter ubique]|nr:outer membrane beta-barrel protein [Candidatus Pelagibacter ubique]